MFYIDREATLRKTYRRLGADRGHWQNVADIAEWLHGGEIDIAEYCELRQLNNILLDLLFSA